MRLNGQNFILLDQLLITVQILINSNLQLKMNVFQWFYLDCTDEHLR